jgi:hypothetical protein
VWGDTEKRHHPPPSNDEGRGGNERSIVITAISLMMLVFLVLYLNLSGVFNRSYGKTLQFSFYTPVVFVALAIGIGIQPSYEDDGAITPLALGTMGDPRSELLPEP